MEETLLLTLIQSVSIVFITIVCLTTYGINRMIIKMTNKTLPRYTKSLISLIVGICTMILYIYRLDASLETVLLSFLICTFGYDLLIKPCLKSFKQRISNITKD